MYTIRKISEILNCKAAIECDFEMKEVSIDSRSVSRPETTLFFALQGANHDGHDYVGQLYDRGVRCFVVSERRPEFSRLGNACFLEVGDTLEALQHLAQYHREHVRAEVVGITGSNGKTVVKEWLYQLLADEEKVYRSPRSYNSQVGVPLSLLGIEENIQTAIIEAGISKPGEMERLQRMIRPEIGIFTHLGDAHGENFSSLQQKLEEKSVLFRDCQCVIGRAGNPCNILLRWWGRMPWC